MKPQLLQDNYDGEWHKPPFTIKLTGDDGKCSGITETRYKLNGGDEQSGTEVEIENEGTHELEYWSIDNKENEEQPHKILSEIKIDATSPKTTIDISGTKGGDDWYVSTVKVTLSAEDGLSGVDVTKYRLNGGDFQEYSDQFVVDSDGEHTVEYYSIDKAGNQEKPQSESFKIDTQPPTTSISVSGDKGENDWYISDVTVDCNASDTVSGVKECLIKVDDGSWRTPPVKIKDEGEHTVAYYATDKAGNKSEEQSEKIKLDKNPPEFDNWTHIPDELNVETEGDFTIQVTIRDAISGVSGTPQLRYKINGDYTDYENMSKDGENDWIFKILEDWKTLGGKTIKYKIKASDSAGNEDESIEITTNPVVDYPFEVTVVTSREKLSANGSDQATITATVEDRHGNSVKYLVVEDKEIFATIEPARVGTISGIVNNGDGTYSATYTAPDKKDAEKVTITFNTSNGKSGSVDVPIVSKVAKVDIEESPEELPADGESTASVVIVVEDSLGNGIPGEEVTVKVSLGKVDSPAVEEKDGRYTTTFTAASEIGIVTLTAEVQGIKSEAKTFLLTPHLKEVMVTGSPAKAGDKLAVKLKGSAKGDAKFSIVGVPNASDLKMTEGEPGIYSGEYIVVDGDNAADAKVTVTLGDEHGNVATDDTQKVTLDTIPLTFALSASPKSRTVGRGSFTVYDIKLESQGYIGLIDLFATKFPNGSSGEFNPPQITLSNEKDKQESQLTVRTSENADLVEEHLFKVLAVPEEGSKKEIDLTLTVTKILTRLILVVSPPPNKPSNENIKVGETLNVSGWLEDEEKHRLPNLEVTFTATPPDGNERPLEVAKTDDEGKYSFTLEPDQRGKWDVSVVFEGNDKYESSSAEGTCQVGKGDGKVTLEISGEKRLGSTVTIEVKLKPAIETKIGLSIYHKPATEKNWTLLDKIDLESKPPGVFRHSLELDKSGDWKFRANWDGNDDYEGDEDDIELNAPEEFGKAIILHGGENEKENPGDWDKFHPLAEDVYDILKLRRLKDEDIYYISPISQRPPHVDATTSTAALQFAIETWAKERLNKYIPLFIYLLSHNERKEGSKFLIKKDESLTAKMLNEMLSKLPKEVRVVIVVEACYAGNFITAKGNDGKPLLASENRILVTSTRDDKQSFLAAGVSFSQYLLEGIYYNLSLGEAFVKAKSLMENNRVLSDQLPQLDADGDGNATDIDETVASEIYIPANFTSLANPLEITEISEAQTLEEREDTAKLWVKTSTTVDVEVFGTVIPPDFDPKNTYQDWPDFDRIDFTWSKDENRFEATYDKFTEPGVYTIIINARSPDSRASPLQTTVEVESSHDVSTSEKQQGVWGKVKQTALRQNYPNPCNPETWIPYQLSEASYVNIRIYDIKGQLVRKLEQGSKQAGAYLTKRESAYWDGRSDAGEEVASGLYFYVLQAGRFMAVKKMLVLR